MPVRVERRDRVLTVIHSRPEVRNAVDSEHAEALWAGVLGLLSRSGLDLSENRAR